MRCQLLHLCTNKLFRNFRTISTIFAPCLNCCQISIWSLGPLWAGCCNIVNQKPICALGFTLGSEYYQLYSKIHCFVCLSQIWSLSTERLDWKLMAGSLFPPPHSKKAPEHLFCPCAAWLSSKQEFYKILANFFWKTEWILLQDLWDWSVSEGGMTGPRQGWGA